VSFAVEMASASPAVENSGRVGKFRTIADLDSVVAGAAEVQIVREER